MRLITPLAQLTLTLALLISAAPASADYLPSGASAEQRVSALERTRAYLQSDAFVASRLELRRLSDDAPRDLVELALNRKLSQDLRQRAIKCLALYRDDARAKLALTALLDQLSSRDGLYPQVIVSYLEHQGEDGAARVVALLDDESATVREAAVIALGLYGGQLGYDALRVGREQEQDPRVLRALGQYAR